MDCPFPAPPLVPAAAWPAGQATARVVRPVDSSSSPAFPKPP